MICRGNQIEIITTTSQISTIVQEIGQSKINVSILIPPGICPGHYEIRPGDIKKLYNNGILLYHGWEGFIDDIKKAVSDSNTTIFSVNVPGSWLIPEVQTKAAEKIAQILSESDPLNKNFYMKNLDLYKTKMIALDKKIKNTVDKNKLSGMPVVASEKQKDFLDYLGFHVIDTFGADEEITPGRIIQIINNIKKYNVKIIVSNLQSGTSTGTMLSKRTKIPHVVLTNFPGGFQNTETIEKTIMTNLYLLINAVRSGK